MPKKRKKKYVNPLGEDGKLRYPPKKSKEEEEEERRELEKERRRKKATTVGTISLYELLSGEFRRKQQLKKERIEKRKRAKENIMQRQKMEFVGNDPV